jgi:hypothetical protein
MEMDKIVQKYYAEFIDVDQVTLFELVTAANFMDIKPLLDLTCLAVSFYIKVCLCYDEFVFDWYAILWFGCTLLVTHSSC